MFPVYLKLGIDHILSITAYDHIVFLIALCAVYAATDWKRILILVTAFTIGHSITLAMSSLKIISVKPDLVELLIPITILLTAIQNLLIKQDKGKRWSPHYFLALFFGFIHGMGFSNYFKELLGKEADIITPLFAFNIGVELGQLCIVAGIMLLNYLIVKKAKMLQQHWNIAISVIAGILSIYMIYEKLT